LKISAWWPAKRAAAALCEQQFQMVLHAEIFDDNHAEHGSKSQMKIEKAK